MAKIERSQITIKRVQYINAGFSVTQIEEGNGETFFYSTNKLGVVRRHVFADTGEVSIEEMPEGIVAKVVEKEIEPVAVVDEIIPAEKPVQRKKTRTKKDAQ